MCVKNDIHDLGLVLDSKARLILIESWDEPRVLQTLTGLALRRGLGLQVWSVTEGLQRLGFAGDSQTDAETLEPEAALRLIKADSQPTLYVMCDLHPFLEDNPRLVRLLKEVAMREPPGGPTLVLVSHACKLPPEVQRYASRFSLALPSEDELLAIVRDEASAWSARNRNARVRTDNRTLQQVVKNLRGLSHAEARALARNVICDDGAITQEDIPELNKTKFQLLDLEGVLSFEYDTARFAEVGGLGNLKRWLAERQGIFLEGKGSDLPKGVLLVGVQGGGKSLAAKAVAGLWGLPLLRLDFACLYNKFFGETERNLRDALKLAEQMAPCVLWIDEIEKGLASGDHDGGVSQRVLGTLLTWMAERKAPVFMVATANVIARLPPELVRLLKEIALAEGAHKPTLVLVSHALKLPVEVQRYAARFALALPSEDELLAIVRDEATRWSEANRGARVRTDNRTLQQVVKNLRGMSHAEARALARRVICDDGAITQDDLPELNKSKFQLLDLEGVLSFEYDTARFAEVGGLRTFKRWLSEREPVFHAAKAEDLPKGVLLVGVQGGGKSLAAKAVAGLWGLPLLRLDFACLYNKFFGETERNLREALQLAERMAPCVLWMDEIEKGLASGDQDGGVSQRVLGTLLTWMAERKAPVFLVATANAIYRLPPELVRKGRFDELFFVDLPDAEVRAEIFAIHLQRRELEPAQFDLPALAAACEGFAGAEIEQAVVSALYAAQARQQSVDQALLLQMIHSSSPLSVVMAEDLARLRAWADGRTVSAD